MKEIKASKSFKKDLKRYANQPKKLRKLYDFVDNYLRTGAAIPEKYHAHMLIGDYAGHMECHIEGDYLLIWIDEETNVVKLIRLGSHSELFG
ncbi:MAG: type II toxin-antitoxin system YafQ family toxin [Bacteroides sp.]|nr:type II toxin-antitoxin system YafQ family toxin [Bacteroides sp.]MCM1456593.1 type II toxin-antitoxin system YafQ family toxin [Lachnoclostridium sp.]